MLEKSWSVKVFSQFDYFFLKVRVGMAQETWVQSQVKSYQRLKNVTWCPLA